MRNIYALYEVTVILRDGMAPKTPYPTRMPVKAGEPREAARMMKNCYLENAKVRSDALKEVRVILLNPPNERTKGVHMPTAPLERVRYHVQKGRLVVFKPNARRT